MAVTPIPAAPVVPRYPALGSATFNQEAYAYGTAMPGVTQRIHAIAQAARSNAVESGAQAQAAAQYRTLAVSETTAIKNAAVSETTAIKDAAVSETTAIKDAAVSETTAIANTARDYRDAAAASALSADGAANYQGDYDPLKTYTVGQSVSYGMQRFVAKRTVTGVTPVDGANWLLIRPGVAPTLQGDPAPYVTQTKTYQITNYSSFSSYAVSASAGTASISGDTITYTAPGTAGSRSLTLTVDGQPTAFVINVQPAPSYIPTPKPTPATFGAPFEGGFYYGMTWGALSPYKSTTFVTCSQSKTLSTGTHAFTINVNMSSTPVVYAGQNIEVRSRANPNNKFIGTVTNATGNVITLNVTSISGSGTFSDWSFMSRYRLIAAPKASGEHTGIALKNSNSALPTACQTLTEGWAATMAMFTADTSTVYPAAHWARNLVINGFDDFFIPARDQLEPCWRNLKPVTDNNYVTASRPTAASFSYANNGSYGDTANTHGLNNNSAPTGAAYTTTVPAQTAATAFRTGGTEAFEFGSAYYWSSSDYNAAGACSQSWYSSSPGRQNDNYRANTYRVRAIRRSII